MRMRRGNRYVAFCSAGLIVGGLLDGMAQWYRQAAQDRAALREAARQQEALRREGMAVEPSPGDGPLRGGPRMQEMGVLAAGVARARARRQERDWREEQRDRQNRWRE